MIKDFAVLTLVLSISFTIIYGWVMNIVNLISGDVYTSISTVVVGVAGIFVAPVGALVHFIAG